MYRSRTWSCIASRTAAAKRARRVLFPRTSQSFFSFRTSAGSFLLAFPFLLREKKRGDSGYTVRAFLLVRMILLTVFFGYKPRLYPGFRVENRVTPHSDAGSRKENLTSKLAGISGSRIGVRDDQMTVSGAMTKTRSPVRPMGESGKKNGGEGRTWEKDV